MNYWQECVSTAIEEAGIVATDEQIALVAEAIEGGFENYDMAHGYDVIGVPVELQAQRELRELKQKIEAHEQWERSTEPCKRCTTTGTVLDGWGRDMTCPDCNGKGRR